MREDHRDVVPVQRRLQRLRVQPCHPRPIVQEPPAAQVSSLVVVVVQEGGEEVHEARATVGAAVGGVGPQLEAGKAVVTGLDGGKVANGGAVHAHPWHGQQGVAPRRELGRSPGHPPHRVHEGELLRRRDGVDLQRLEPRHEHPVPRRDDVLHRRAALVPAEEHQEVLLLLGRRQAGERWAGGPGQGGVEQGAQREQGAGGRGGRGGPAPGALGAAVLLGADGVGDEEVVVLGPRAERQVGPAAPARPPLRVDRRPGARRQLAYLGQRHCGLAVAWWWSWWRRLRWWLWRCAFFLRLRRVDGAGPRSPSCCPPCSRRVRARARGGRGRGRRARASGRGGGHEARGAGRGAEMFPRRAPPTPPCAVPCAVPRAGWFLP